MSNLIEVGGIAVHGDYLYWVDTSSGQLNRVNKMTGEDKQLILGKIGEPTDVLVVDKHSFDGKLTTSIKKIVLACLVMLL